MQPEDSFIDQKIEGYSVTQCIPHDKYMVIQANDVISPIPNTAFKLTFKKVTPHPIKNNKVLKSLSNHFFHEQIESFPVQSKNLLSLSHDVHQTQYQLLSRILALRKLPEETTNKVLECAENMIYHGESSKLLCSLSGSQETTLALGQLLHFADKAPEKTLQKLSKERVQDFCKRNLKEVQGELAAMKKQLPWKISRQIALTIEIAKLLILSDGSLNHGILSMLIKEFIPDKPSIYNYALTLKGGLQLLQQSPSIRELLEMAQLSVHPTAVEVVNTILQKEAGTLNTLREQKIAILSAFLTHMRQGKISNCFASFIAIEQQAMNPEQTLRDLIQLVGEGHLKRYVDGQLKEFPYLLQFGEEQMNPLTFHPLLRVWENSIAGMTEAKCGGLLNSALTTSLAYLMEKKCKQLKIKEYPQDFKSLIAKKASEQLLYLFDPAKTSQGLKEFNGAFVLYEKKGADLLRIDSSIDFFNYAEKLIAETLGPEYATSPFNEKERARMISKLLSHYHPSNAEIKDKPEMIEATKYTPWKTAIGNNPNMALYVYREQDHDVKNIELKPRLAIDLFQEIQRVIHALSPDRRRALQQSSPSLTPMRIPGNHVFSFMINHPTLLPYYDRFETLPSLQPFKSIPCTKSMRRSVLSKLDEKYLLNSAEKLKKADLGSTIHSFSHSLLDHLKGELRKDIAISSLQNQIDKWIYEALPEKKRLEIEKTVVHFADTNWQYGIHDIHYGIGVNPCSGEMELMTVLDNGKIYKFLNQSEYLHHHTWEIGLKMTDSELKKLKHTTC